MSSNEFLIEVYDQNTGESTGYGYPVTRGTAVKLNNGQNLQEYLDNGGVGNPPDLDNYYNKTESDEKFADKEHYHTQYATIDMIEDIELIPGPKGDDKVLVGDKENATSNIEVVFDLDEDNELALTPNTTIIDNLIEGGSTNVLSAEQGKILNQKINEIYEILTKSKIINN